MPRALLVGLYRARRSLGLTTLRPRFSSLAVAVLIFGGCYPLAARAEQFLGIEGEDNAGLAPVPGSKPAAQKKTKAARTQVDASEALDEVDAQDAEAGRDSDAPNSSRSAAAESHGRMSKEAANAGTDDFSLSGGLGAGIGYFSGQVTLSYHLSRYASVDTSYAYYRFDNTDTTGQQYGPECDLVLQLPNKSPLTPFVGPGPGYLKWSRVSGGAPFDDSSSLTGNAFGGINLRLSKHFGLQLERKQVVYASEPPRTFADPAQREARTQVATNIGFRAMF